ncbi:hypothetical protein D3C74_222890 [compost metagenome]
MMKTRDIDIRMSLHHVLKNEHLNEPDTLILDELALCQGDARIDVAVVNGTMNGYEIKSESDTLERLPKQSEVYNKVFDTITILTANRFIDELTDIIPEWWGVTQVEMDNDGLIYFFPIREAMQNPCIDRYALAQLLWKEEALHLLKKRDLHKGYLSKPRTVLWEAISENISLSDLQNEVRNYLKSRKRWRVQ